MVGLAEGGHATVGVIVAPAWGRAFVGVVGQGAWEIGPDGAAREIHVSTRDALAGATFVVSRTRAPEKLAAFIASVGGKTATHGSSGLKGASWRRARPTCTCSRAAPACDGTPARPMRW